MKREARRGGEGKEEKSEFSESLKYTVVQDIAKEMQKETVREVKKEEKEQKSEETER